MKVSFNNIKLKSIITLTRSSLLILFLSLVTSCIKQPDIKGPDAYINSQHRKYAFYNVNVVPMNDDKIIPSQTVIVEEGRIVQIGKIDIIEIHKSVKKIDGKGSAYLMPGLADMHGHLNESHYLRLLIANGVTTVRNMLGSYQTLEYKNDIKEYKRIGPTIYSSGPIIDGFPPNYPGLRVVRSPEDGKKAVTETYEQGFDFVKVYSGLSKESYEAITTSAKEYNLPVVGHVPLEVGFEAALTAGQSSFEHLEGSLYAMKNEIPDHSRYRNWNLDFDEARLSQYLEKTVKTGVWNCPTLVVYKHSEQTIKSLKSRPEMKYISQIKKNNWNNVDWQSPKENRDKRTYLVKRLHQAGANLLLGTDFANPYVIPGFSIHDELERFVECGLTPYEAIKTGTVNAAELMNKQDLFGTVEVGKKADLILIAENPLDNVAHVKNPLGVMVNGLWFPKKALEKMLSDVEKDITLDFDY